MLVTGANGFLGSHIVAELVSAGSRVLAVDVAKPSAPVVGLWAGQLGVIYQVSCDTRDENSLRDLIHRFEPWAVVHAAAMTTADTSNQLDRMYNVNVRGSESVFSATGNRRLVYISSGSVYQASVDDASIYSELDAPTVGRSEVGLPVTYASTKRSGELLVAERRLDNFDYRIVRVAACFGPAERPTVGRRVVSIARRMAEAVREGYCPDVKNDAVVDLTYVRDTARGVLAVLAADQVHDITNVGAGRGVRLSEIAQAFRLTSARQKPSNSNCPTRLISLPRGSRHGVLETQRLARLGFKPIYPLSRSVALYLDWLEHHEF